MIGSRFVVLVTALLGAGCGFGAKSPSGDGAPAATSGRISGSAGSAASLGADARSGAGAVALDWEDPEPPEAQALAERVVGAEWNRNKRTGLSMRITTLVDRTSGIEGFATNLAAAETALDDRLSRLGAEVTGTQVRIRLAGSVLFDFDSAAIRPDAERTLSEVAEVIRAYASRPVVIEGHTDSIASDAYNLELSARRADAVKAWLANRGVEAGRLGSVGHGESKPVADNATPAGRQSNRRVEIVIETS